MEVVVNFLNNLGSRDFYIDCKKRLSCYQSIINCPSANCVIKCNGWESCSHFRVIGGLSTNLLQIECNGYHGCYQSNINFINNQGSVEISSNSTYWAVKAQLESSIINASSAKSLNIKAEGREVLAFSKMAQIHYGLEF